MLFRAERRTLSAERRERRVGFWEDARVFITVFERRWKNAASRAPDFLGVMGSVFISIFSDR